MNTRKVIDHFNKNLSALDSLIKRHFRLSPMKACMLAFIFLTSAAAASSATLTVTKTEDTNDGSCAALDCSLREAVAAAAPGDTIVFASPLFDSPQTITLLLQSTGSFSGLAINKGLTITGKGAQLLTIQRLPPANNSERLSVLSVNAPAATVTLSGMTITGGHGPTGGGINAANASLVIVSGCHITGNTIYTSSGGGGISSNAPLTVINTTISNNSSPDNLGNFGGGIDAGGNLTVINSTISGNGGSTTIGGGIFISGGATVITNSTIADNLGRADAASGIFTGSVTRVGNSIIAGNRNSSTTPDIGGGGGFISLGYNLIGNTGAITTFNQTGDQTGVSNPGLAALAMNGGTTPTHGLLSTSPAIDKGNGFGAGVDQRGSPRPVDHPNIPPAQGGDNSDIGAYEVSNEAVPMPRALFDFDGDGRANYSVVRPSDRNWYIKNDNGYNSVQFGLSTDKLTPADFDGDGKTDIAVWREGAPGVAAFYILQSLTNAVRIEQFGQSGDEVNVVGDWDGDGKADPAVYRDSAFGSQSYFFYRGSLNNPGGATVYLPWGTSGDEALRGDFDGDSIMDAAVYRSSNSIWYIRRSSDNSLLAAAWGINSDKRINGDFDGDGRTDFAVFRQTDTTWYVLRSSNNQPLYQRWGLSTDQLVPADFDGDGKTDFAVYRNGMWYVLRSFNSSISIENFGFASDIPVPSAYTP